MSKMTREQGIRYASFSRIHMVQFGTLDPAEPMRGAPEECSFVGPCVGQHWRLQQALQNITYNSISPPVPFSTLLRLDADTSAAKSTFPILGAHKNHSNPYTVHSTSSIIPMEILPSRSELLHAVNDGDVDDDYAMGALYSSILTVSPDNRQISEF